MKKMLIGVFAMVCTSSLAFADYNTSDNMSVKHLKTGNRNATTSAEGAYYNPAGLPWGMAEGLTVEFSELPSYQKDEISVEYEQTAFGTTPNLRTAYNVVKAAPFIPAMNIVYKKNNWAGFVNIGLAKGGGTGEAENGLPSFGRAVRGVLIGSGYDYLSNVAGDPNALLSTISLVDNPDMVSIESDGTSTIASLGVLVGGAYALNDTVSFGGGLRYAYQQSNTEASILTTNLSGNPMYDIINTDIDIEYEENGSCFGVFLNMALRPTEKMMITNTLKYHTTLEMEADVEEAGGPYASMLQEAGFVPETGETYEATYAPQWSLGIAYQVTPKLRTELDANVFFVSMVDENDDADKYEDTNQNIGVGMEYQLNDKWNIGGGFTYGFGIGLKDAFQSESEYDNHTLWLNSGASYLIREHFELTVAGQVGLQLEDPEQEHEAAVTPTDPSTVADLSYTETYSAGTAMSVAFGLAYRF